MFKAILRLLRALNDCLGVFLQGILRHEFSSCVSYSILDKRYKKVLSHLHENINRFKNCNSVYCITFFLTFSSKIHKILIGMLTVPSCCLKVAVSVLCAKTSEYFKYKNISILHIEFTKYFSAACGSEASKTWSRMNT